jgi:hypothetical protein
MRRYARFIPFLVTALLLAACVGVSHVVPSTAPQTQGAAQTDAVAESMHSPHALLDELHSITTIGSTVDPQNGDVNPYGLAIAPVSSGLIRAGDFIICNFNNSANIQGTGTTIVGLHPHVGSSPYHIAQAQSLLGCNALALAQDDDIWTADFAANDNAVFSSAGKQLSTLSQFAWMHPFGEIGAPLFPFASAFYVSNAADGSIVRVSGKLAAPAFTTIATGFSVNGGPPGSILGPSGLTYDPERDTLYIVDGNANRLIAFEHVSRIRANGITVSGNGFSGPAAHDARVVASGPPINGPISAALLPNGDVVIGNTLDPNGTNLLIEISPAAGVVATKNVDTGASGAIFGIVASGTTADPKIYFNDDNANALTLVSR